MLKRVKYHYDKETGDNNIDYISRQEDGINAARQLMDDFNKYSIDEDDPFVRGFLTEILNHTHRTIQEDFVKGFIMPFIKYYADKIEDGHYDARNEYTAKLMAFIRDALMKDDVHFFNMDKKEL